MMPNLFTDVVSPHPQRPCPRCRVPVDVRLYTRRGVRANAKCPDCGVLAADDSLKEWCRQWATDNVALLRQTLGRLKPPLLEELTEDLEVVQIAFATVVQAKIGHDTTGKSKFSTWVVGLLKQVAKRFPRRHPTVSVDLSRIEARAG